jgi:soluble lytic murein transglycosylase-like protein
MAKSSLRGQLTLGITALAAIVVAASQVKPIYVGQAPVVQRLVAATWRDSAAARAPWALDSGAAVLATAQFEADRRAFASDLVSTGRVSTGRADTLATFAVREAYKRRVPPALVFGVLMTENSTFKSHARSNVGAVGLMQVYPKIWVPTLGKIFGRDLRDDETNLRYGVHILSHYVYTAARKAPDPANDPRGTVRTALLRYNGCVRGTNTPNCMTYPDKVMRAVEQFALAQCGAGGFEECVSRPMRLRLDATTTAVATGEVAVSM